MVHIYIGDGKGKTTAALGLALRASGWEKRIYIAQFLKGEQASCGEIKAIEGYLPKIKIERFKNQTHPMFVKKEEADIEKIKESIKDALAKIEGYIEAKEFDLIILDEILNAQEEGFTHLKDLERIIQKGRDIEFILTGKNAPDDLIALADYVSSINKIKHPYDKKILARKSIEY